MSHAKVKVFYKELRVTGYGLRVAGCELWVMSYGFRVTSYELRVMG